MGKTDDETQKRLALHRLAIATNYLLPEQDRARDLWFRVYLDGLANFHPNTVTTVCRRLETQARDGWFPKLPELVEDMRAFLKRKQDEVRPSMQIQGKPVTPERIAGLRDAVNVAIQKKAMR